MSAFVIEGDCLAAMRTMPSACVHAIVSDPPYGLSSEPNALELLQHWLGDYERERIVRVLGGSAFAVAIAELLHPRVAYVHGGSGFMGKSWDSFVPGPEVWREALRVLKPGGHAIVFSGTRTYDLTVLAMRIAGFEVRDQGAWMYTQGMAKSLDVSYALDKAAGVERPDREVSGYTDCPTRVAFAETKDVTNAGTPVTELAQEFDGWGTGLSPSQEPWVLARRPFAGTIAANVAAHRTGALNLAACAVGPNHELLPKNVLLDEVAAAIANMQRPGSGGRFFVVPKPNAREKEFGCEHLPAHAPTEVTGRKPGSAGQNNPRSGMAGKKPRHNHHPTVKPIGIMRELVRLVTPRGGVVLDPYTGSGTTGCACVLEGLDFVGCELSSEFVAIARARINAWTPR